MASNQRAVPLPQRRNRRLLLHCARRSARPAGRRHPRRHRRRDQRSGRGRPPGHLLDLLMSTRPVEARSWSGGNTGLPKIGGSGMRSIQRRALTLVAAGAFVSGGLLVVPGPLAAPERARRACVAGLAALRRARPRPGLSSGEAAIGRPCDPVRLVALGVKIEPRVSKQGHFCWNCDRGPGPARGPKDSPSARRVRVDDARLT